MRVIPFSLGGERMKERGWIEVEDLALSRGAAVGFNAQDQGYKGNMDTHTHITTHTDRQTDSG